MDFINKFRKKINQRINFIVCGAQKSGTSALDYYLRQHPQIGMSTKKEVHFFDNEALFSSPTIDYKKYHQHFIYSKTNIVYGETTPIYLYKRPCAQRIKEYNPNIKLIFILRNPIERAFSHWNMEYNKKKETKDFSQCIREEKDFLQHPQNKQHRIFSYVDRGFYSKQVFRFQQHFANKQLLFIKYDDFKTEQQETLIKIFDFIGVESNHYTYKEKTVHHIPKIRSLTIEDKQYLTNLYREDIEQLEQQLNWNCRSWLL